MSLLVIDGARGEGGGQILRTALALSAITGRSICVERIRAGRKRPGLRRQHLAAVRAAAQICGAEITGDAPGSRRLEFHPNAVRGGAYTFSIGTAGSACLVLQTVLLPLLAAPSPSTVALEGGTHNPGAPPFDFLDRCFVPLLWRMGARVALELDRLGFYPAGGGRFRARVEPCEQLAPLYLSDAGTVRGRRARALVANLPEHIATRELAVVRGLLDWDEAECVADVRHNTAGPGNVLLLEVERDHVTTIVTGFGRRGVPAERVAEKAVHDLRRHLSAEVPVGPHLADQLLLPLALAGGGMFRTGPLSAHAKTNVDVIQAFIDIPIAIAPAGDGVVVTIGPSKGN